MEEKTISWCNMDPFKSKPSILAYLGDAVYELRVRQYLISLGTLRVNELHAAAVKLVKATTQAQVMHRIIPLLDEDEASLMRRARNAKTGPAPKNTGIVDYRYATAFEALIGFWHLIGREDRIDLACKYALEIASP